MALRLPPLRFGPLSQNGHCMPDGEEIPNRFLLEDCRQARAIRSC